MKREACCHGGTTGGCAKSVGNILGGTAALGVGDDRAGKGGNYTESTKFTVQL